MKTIGRSQLTPELVAHFPRPGTAIPGRIQYSPDSQYVTYLFSVRGDLTRDLWRLEVASGRKEHWLSPPGEAVTEENVSLEEALRRERQRLRETGITDYIWAEKANVMLIPLSGDLYRWSQGMTERVATGGIIDPKISRDGRRIFFVRDADVWTVDGEQERRLTTHPPNATNGLAEFVAQEELDRLSGYWPSPSAQLVAFAQVDESNIPVYPIVHQGTPNLLVEEHRYPFAGAENARVKLAVVNVQSGATTFMDLGTDDGYIARVAWHPDGRLFVQWLSRDWHQLHLTVFDATSGAGKPIVVEQQEPWINLHDDLRFIEATGEFTWSSERTGFRHLYLYAADGRLIRQLTQGSWPAEATVELDERRRQVYFLGWQDSPLERHLFRVALDGGPVERLTTEPGVHGAVVAPDHSTFVDVWDNVTTPPSVTLRTASGEKRAVIQPAAKLDLELPAPELRSFRTRDGAELYAAIYRPFDESPSPLGEGRVGAPAPVIVEVYGLAGVQLVNNSWAETVDMRAQMLAQHGFIVLKVDNRGSSRRGLAFEAPIYRQQGQLELRDQIEGVRWLGTLGGADLSRVGIYGWSGGGFMTLLALVRAPEIFKVGVSGAPVTFQEGYDTAYMEKYMSTPQANSEGYKNSSPLTYVDQLQGKLLLVHGMIDENVHFRHTARMMQALIDAGKPFETLIYPNERHMPRSERDRADMERRILEFFETSL